MSSLSLGVPVSFCRLMDKDLLKLDLMRLLYTKINDLDLIICNLEAQMISSSRIVFLFGNLHLGLVYSQVEAKNRSFIWELHL